MQIYTDPTNRRKQRAIGPGPSLLIASSGRLDRGSRQVWGTRLLRDLRGSAEELALTGQYRPEASIFS
uniref:Uncharacterized protein n=1 Tax=Romanomermis culicivorax TaxID=13658 RepID=A0A915IGB2_ROMCU